VAAEAVQVGSNSGCEIEEKARGQDRVASAGALAGLGQQEFLGGIMSDTRLRKAMTRYFELWGAVAEDNIAQQVAYAAGEIERGELPDQVVAMFRRANELRAWHKARGRGAPEAADGPIADDPHSSRLAERGAPIAESPAETSCIRTDMLALINVAQQALDSLIVERMELVRLQRSTHHVDTTIRAARQQLGELHRAALEHRTLYNTLSGEPSAGDQQQSRGGEQGRESIDPPDDTGS
jgi:hypothetical protein